MGAVDLVIQIESPPSVASALQRVGRAGHQVGEVSRGRPLPQAPRRPRADRRRRASGCASGAIEALRVPANPLDVLAQQVVAAMALDGWDVDELYAAGAPRRRRSRACPGRRYDATLDLLAGRYPSDEFAELRPRIVWDRVAGTLTGRPGAQRLAVTSGGTIPDRGLFGVFLVGGEAGQPGRRVGELDEEMVYESRVGDVFALGATSWRIEDITHDRVLVTPAPGVPGRLPFWKGDTLGRPAELGAAVGAFTRELAALPRGARRSTWRAPAGSTTAPPPTCVAYLAEQREATRRAAQRPDDPGRALPRRARRLAAGRPLPLRHPGARAVGAGDQRPPARALRRRRPGDGRRRRHRDPDPRHRRRAARAATWSSSTPTRSTSWSPTEVGGSALFASRFRECAARALLLPRRDPGRRSPLWQQRQRSARSCSRWPRSYPSFPIVLEAVRECLQDVYDLPALTALHRAASSVARSRSTTSPPPSRRRSRGACCSATSPSSSTRATPPSPSAAPPRCRSTRGCSPSCSAAPSCASCSTPRCSPRSRPSCSGSPPTAGPATPRASPTCCGCSARSIQPRWHERCTDGRRRRRLAGRARRRPAGGRRCGWRGGRAVGGGRGRRPAARRARASRSRPAPPRPSPSRSTTRSATWSAATPAPTARSPPTRSPSGSASALAVVRHTLQRLAAQGRVLDGEFRPAGSGHGVVRRRGAAPAAAPLAGPAAPGGRAGRARRRSAGSCPPGSGSTAGAAGVARCAASTACSPSSTSSPAAPVPASRAGVARARRPGCATTSPPCSTS